LTRGSIAKHYARVARHVYIITNQTRGTLRNLYPEFW
jgi:hypothetical protein